MKVMLGSGCIGALIGVALSIYAHTGNGFLTGPIILFGFAISLLGGLVAACLLVIGKRSLLVYGLATFSVAMLSILILLPLVWPYTNLNKSVPF
jgi:hypothetical protein